MSLRRRAVSPLALHEEPIRDAILDLVRFGYQVALVNRDRAVEFVNASDSAVFDKRFDDVLEPGRSVAMSKDSGQRGSAQIQINVNVIAQQVLSYNLALERIEAVAVEGRAHAYARRQREARE